MLADFEKLCGETVRIAKDDKPELRIGYLKCYGGYEFRQAVAGFSEKFPDVSVHIINGNHEDLYDSLRLGRVDLVLSDQRRAFSEEYVNLVLKKSECCVEIASRHPFAAAESLEIDDLKTTPCILVASQAQQENERTYYRDIVGIQGEYLFADNLEEARLAVIGGKGFMPIEGGEYGPQFDIGIKRVQLKRKGKPIARNYCAFWKVDNSGYYIESFAELLQSFFE